MLELQYTWYTALVKALTNYIQEQNAHVINTGPDLYKKFKYTTKLYNILTIYT